MCYDFELQFTYKTDSMAHTRRRHALECCLSDAQRATPGSLSILFCPRDPDGRVDDFSGKAAEPFQRPYGSRSKSAMISARIPSSSSRVNMPAQSPIVEASLSFATEHSEATKYS